MSEKEKLILSALEHTWMFDIDGTIVKHNGYKIDGFDTILPGVKEFFKSIPDGDKIIFLTSREEKYKKMTEEFLVENEIRFDLVVYDLPYGERIIINDSKPSNLQMAYAINLRRDKGIDRKLIINKSL